MCSYFILTPFYLFACEFLWFFTLKICLLFALIFVVSLTPSSFWFVRIPSILINIQYVCVCLYIKYLTSIWQTVSILLLRAIERSICHIRFRFLSQILSLPLSLSLYRSHSSSLTPRWWWWWWWATSKTYPIPTIHPSIQIQFRTHYVITYFQFSWKMEKCTSFLLFYFAYIYYHECDVIWWGRYTNVVCVWNALIPFRSFVILFAFSFYASLCS